MKRLFAIIALLLPSQVFAISGPSPDIATTANLPQFTTLSNGSTGLLDQIIGLGIWLFWIVAVAFLVIAGYQYLTARGEEDQIGKAKNSIIYSLVGMIVVSLSYAIRDVFQTLQDPDGTVALDNFETNLGEGFVDPILSTVLTIGFTVAVIFIIVAAYQFLTASGDEEKVKKGKNSLTYSIVGMIVLALAYAIRDVFQTLQSSTLEGFTEETGTLSAFQAEFVSFLDVLIKGVMFLSGTIAILFVIVGAYLFLSAAGDEEQVKKGKNSLIFSVVGLIILVLSRTIVTVFYAEGGPAELGGRQISVSGIKGLINSIINLATGFVGGLSILMLIYAGFLWITAGGEEAQAEKAKKIITYAIIGLAVIIFSYSIVAILVNPSV